MQIKVNYHYWLIDQSKNQLSKKLEAKQSRDPFCKKIIRYIKEPKTKQFFLDHKNILKRISIIAKIKVHQIVVPASETQLLIYHYHNEGSHLSVNKTCQRMSEIFIRKYWLFAVLSKFFREADHHADYLINNVNNQMKTNVELEADRVEVDKSVLKKISKAWNLAAESIRRRQRLEAARTNRNSEYKLIIVKI